MENLYLHGRSRKELHMDRLPVIALDGLENSDAERCMDVVAMLRAACLDTGFLYVTRHNIAPSVIDRVRNAVELVFSQPDSTKARFRITPKRYNGYIPLGFFSPAGAGQKADNYEGFKLHIDVDNQDDVYSSCDLYSSNEWPPGLEEASQAVKQYWSDLDRVSKSLLQLFALAVGKKRDFFLPYFESPLTNMTLLHYPPQGKSNDGYGIHPHKDSSAFTIIYPDPVGGLQIMTRDEDWIEAEPPEGALIVNIGDVMEHWTGGQFKSTPHRVINRSGKQRYTFPYFAMPRYDTIIEPVVSPIEGYHRPPILMEHWYRQIIASNWPDAQDIDPKMDPRTPVHGE